MSGAALPRDVPLPARTRGRAQARRVGLVALLAAVVGGAAWYGHEWWTIGRFVASTDDAYVGGNVTTISPHVAGFIDRILVADNQYVQAGQMLVRLDSRDMLAARDHAQAVVDARVAALANLRALVTLQRSFILQAEAERAARTARAAFTRLDDARYASLAQSNSGSRQDAQRAKANGEEAQATLAASGAALDAARQQQDVLAARIAEAQAMIVQARADLATALLDLGYTEIRSPVDGHVGNRAAQIGAYVSQGAYLLSVIPAHGLWIDANFKEDQLARMLPGQKATITADAVPGRTLSGHVVSLAPGTGAVFSVIPPENATGNFTKIVQRVPVRVALDAGDLALGRLRPGLSAIVSVDTRGAP